jgi:hypothetical protein
MSPSGGPLDQLMEAMTEQKAKLTELVTVEFLLAQAGAAAVQAYLDQVDEVKAATAAYAQATAAAKVQKEWQERLSAAGLAVGRSFASASHFAEGLAQAANPTAWATMTDSFQLVGMQLGMNFLPMILRVSIGAQELAQRLAHLTPETQALIAEVAGAAAAMVVFSKAASFANMALLGVPGKLTAKAGDKLGELAAAGLSKIPGAAWGVAGAFGVAALAGFALREALFHAADEIERRAQGLYKPAVQKFTDSEITESPEYKELQSIQDPDARRKRAAELHAAAVAEEARWRNAEEKGPIDSSAPLKFDIPIPLTLTKEAEEAEREGKTIEQKHQEALDKTDLYGRVMEVLVHGLPQHSEKDVVPAETKTAEQLGRFLTHFPKEMQPRFSAVEEARKNFQVQAFKDPLEQEMLRLNRESAKKFLELVPILLQRLRTGQPLGIPLG